MSLRSKIQSLREYITPINTTSNFDKTGEITPQEFVLAGDYLVYKFPTWEWASAPKHLRKSFLPSDKQFLVTKKVPSYQRATDNTNFEVDFDDADGVWIKSPVKNEEIKDLDLDEDDLIIDDDDFAQDDLLRKYDLFISYSTSYRVPKLYLVGYSSNGIPLSPPQMMDDINPDYKDKTATIEPLPVKDSTTSVSIHPCKHANVMKVLMNMKSIRVDQYLVVFLKFISSVTPGIEYDYTMDV